MADFQELVGQTITKIDRGEDSLEFHTAKGVYRMHHEQDCCEFVVIEDIAGELDWLVNSPVICAYESSSTEDPPDRKIDDKWRISFTWTFYRISTNKGTVVIRWYGSSNGYYSESVSFTLLPQRNSLEA